jgi:phosphatidylglycerophosphatase A
MPRLFSWIALSISSTLFSGFLPGKLLGRPGKAGGTAGAAVALIVQFCLLDVGWHVPAAICLASFILGWATVGPAERFLLARWGERHRHTGELVTSDFNETNVDEFHGQFLAGLPVWLLAASLETKTAALLVAFLVFRLFDSVKPWPIKNVERACKGSAFGIMIDDTIAALPGATACAFIIYLRG